MRINLPSNVRAAIYVFTAVGSPVMGYLLARGIIGELEMALWTAEIAAVTAMAALNISKGNRN